MNVLSLSNTFCSRKSEHYTTAQHSFLYMLAFWCIWSIYSIHIYILFCGHRHYISYNSSSPVKMKPTVWFNIPSEHSAFNTLARNRFCHCKFQEKFNNDVIFWILISCKSTVPSVIKFSKCILKDILCRSAWKLLVEGIICYFENANDLSWL